MGGKDNTVSSLYWSFFSGFAWLELEDCQGSLKTFCSLSAFPTCGFYRNLMGGEVSDFSCLFLAPANEEAFVTLHLSP